MADDAASLSGTPDGAALVNALIEKALRLKDPHLLTSMVPLFRPRTYRKGATLLNQGEAWGQAFFIERGIVRIHLVGPDGKDFNKSFWTEGMMVFPITKEMEGPASEFAISALEHTVVWQAPLAELRSGLRRQGLWEPLHAELLRRLLNQKLQREHDLLALDGMARYRKLCVEQPELAARVPLAHLASYLGLTAVSLSRIRRQLKNSREE